MRAATLNFISATVPLGPVRECRVEQVSGHVPWSVPGFLILLIGTEGGFPSKPAWLA